MSELFPAFSLWKNLKTPIFLDVSWHKNQSSFSITWRILMPPRSEMLPPVGQASQVLPLREMPEARQKERGVHGDTSMDGLEWKILWRWFTYIYIRWIIWGYPHFRKPSYMMIYYSQIKHGASWSHTQPCHRPCQISASFFLVEQKCSQKSKACLETTLQRRPSLSMFVSIRIHQLF